MSPLDIADHTQKPSKPYVPSLQRTAGQPPPIAANGGLSYMSFDQDGDAGTTKALEDALALGDFGKCVLDRGAGPGIAVVIERHVRQAAVRRDGRRLPSGALERWHIGRRRFLRIRCDVAVCELELAHGTPPIISDLP